MMRNDVKTALNALTVSCISENLIIPSYVLKIKKLAEAATLTVITPCSKPS